MEGGTAASSVAVAVDEEGCTHRQRQFSLHEFQLELMP
jgi:hypothetical protein